MHVVWESVSVAVRTPRFQSDRHLKVLIDVANLECVCLQIYR